jgi:hypothetical protein
MRSAFSLLLCPAGKDSVVYHALERLTTCIGKSGRTIASYCHPLASRDAGVPGDARLRIPAPRVIRARPRTLVHHLPQYRGILVGPACLHLGNLALPAHLWPRTLVHHLPQVQAPGATFLSGAPDSAGVFVKTRLPWAISIARPRPLDAKGLAAPHQLSPIHHKNRTGSKAGGRRCQVERHAG